MLPLMRLLGSTLVAAALISRGAASSSDAVLHPHEARSVAPLGFTHVGPAAPEQTLQLRFALKQSDPQGLIDALYRVSDPASASYGKYLSKEENLTGTTISSSGDWVSAGSPTVAQANALFNANFTVFKDEDGAEVIRTLSYSLPAELQGHVDLVHPTISFPDSASNVQPNSKKRALYTSHDHSRRNAPPACSNGTSPACLQALYQIPATPNVNPTNRIGVTGFYGNEAHFAYLETFLETYCPDMDPKTNFTVVGVDGGSDEQNPYSVLEGDLDIRNTVGVATDVPVIEYFVGGNTTDGVNGWLDVAVFLANLEDPPQVLTTSYVHQETTWAFSITDKVCQSYAALGARGVTVLYASGDGGPGCSPDNITNFEANFPASCPFLTAVGGTQNYAPEEGWVHSSGGFSSIYARPPYQDAFVPAYLAKLGSANAGRFNASGRDIPDIAAAATDFPVYAAGVFFSASGTSTATPAVADIVALLNDRLISAGRPTLGFLNPWLYSVGYEAFTDITAGNSSVQRGSDNDGPPRGFNATHGWDPVTGLGTPNFDKLLHILGLVR
ncbi:family S53 protease-like protein [Dichomitus squalens LYAD-421 SS1]|uniref:tripeptidyl-peptidase II n=1 Tax=Dichomitus squalens (strain LYAD-421) TaxID=732165 RepID=R7SVI7_DICSQ|nr:family S53 protease-like protein [Dichomitus squalens LYAD-421 SS1]EJF58997.1 family S53 protease-like protein [Dichomitus squalens LYAD-421 SS1]